MKSINPSSNKLIITLSIFCIFTPIFILFQKSPTSTPPTNLIQDEAGWPTYTSLISFFSIQHPPGYEVNQQTDSSLCLVKTGSLDSSCALIINQIKNPNRLSLIEFANTTQDFKNFVWHSSDIFKPYSALKTDGPYYLVLSPDGSIIDIKLAGLGEMELKILSSLKFLEPSPTTVSTVRQIGYVTNLKVDSAGRSFDIDYIEWLTGEAGDRACIEDNKCPPECLQDCLPDGYYIRNNSPLIRTFSISPDVKIDLVDLRSHPSVKTVTLTEFVSIFKSTVKPDWYLPSNLFWITLSGNKVTEINQQYQP